MTSIETVCESKRKMERNRLLDFNRVETIWAWQNPIDSHIYIYNLNQDHAREFRKIPRFRFSYMKNIKQK